MDIRKSTENERNEILNIHKQAFSIYNEAKGLEIAKLVNNLLDDATALPVLSLVAVEDGKIIGHILYTKVTVSGSQVSAQILAPLAILPSHHKAGIGQKLVNEGLRLLKESGTELVFVLGHPTYYPRCGFAPAGVQGFEAPYHIPEEAAAWMVQELNGNILGAINGKVQCSKVLNAPEHWKE